MADEIANEERHRNRLRALRIVGNALFGRNNLIATDFADIQSYRVDWDTAQDSRGIRFQFIVANNAMGKVMKEDVFDALNVLLDGDKDE